MSEAAPPGLPPALAGRYSNARVLGQGSCGLVLYAEDAGLNRPVAIKLLDERFAASPEMIERFRREALLMAKVTSPRVATVYDQDVGGAEGYIVMQYLAGGTLTEHQAKVGPRVPPAEATRILREILLGLEAAHEVGVVHRDLKPDNVMLTTSGDVVITDLGLSRDLAEGGLTQTGAIIGTGAYMAPEQMKGLSPSKSWDLYAAAMIYYQLLAGAFPFVMNNFAGVLAQKLQGLTVPLRRRGLDVPPAVDEWLAAGLAVDPQDRPASARAAVEGLDLAWGAEGPPSGRLHRAAGVEPLPVPDAPATVAGTGPRGSAPSGPRPGATSGPHPATTSGHPAPTSRRTPLVIGGIGLALVAGVLGYLVAPASTPAPATPGATSGTEAPAPRDLPRELRDLRRKVLDSPAIRDAMVMPETTRPGEARLTWVAGREALLRHLENAAELLDAAAVAEPEPALQEAVAPLGILQRLFSRSRLKDLVEVPATPAEQRLARVEARGLKVGERRDLGGYHDGRTLAERRAAILGVLGQGGRRWETVRTDADLMIERDGRLRPERNIRIWSWYDEPFVDPDANTSEVVSIIGRTVVGGKRAATLPSRAEIPLVPTPGDLGVVMVVYGWDPTIVGDLQLIGDPDSVRFAFTVPESPWPNTADRGEPRLVLTFWAPAALVPRGLRSLRVTARGIQAVANPSPMVAIEEVFQQLGGPPLQP